MQTAKGKTKVKIMSIILYLNDHDNTVLQNCEESKSVQPDQESNAGSFT